ncbi:MAG TPA: DUF1801 domain-containing protein [Ilumatobacteraceae bacterium]|nr:DUF1801 domain-containing protein [Ilumatobacteraceae bacterium]
MGTVSDYLATVDPPRRSALEDVIDRVRAQVVQRSAPDKLSEGTSYAMPALLYRGKPLIAVIATKRHLAIYPFSGKVVADVAHRLAGFSCSPGTIRFSETQPVPTDVIDQIVELRMREIDEPAFRQRAF